MTTKKTTKKTVKKKATKKTVKKKNVIAPFLSDGKVFLENHELIKINVLANGVENNRLKMALKEQQVVNINLRIKFIEKAILPDLIKDCEFKKIAFEKSISNKRLFEVEYYLAEKECALQNKDLTILKQVDLALAKNQQEVIAKHYNTSSDIYNTFLKELHDKYQVEKFSYSPFTGELFSDR